MAKKLLIAIILLCALDGAAQIDTMARHHGGGQLGGQSFVSAHYEYSIIARKHFNLLSDIGVGINNYADDTDYENHPAIYSVYHGITTLYGVYPWHLEIGVIPTSFLSSKTSFINLNGWFGIRYMHPDEGVFISLGYTPIIYTSFSDVYDDHLNAFIGLKVGGSF